MKYPTTPDGRYFIHRDRLWRCTNPGIPESGRKVLVRELMAARRAVKAALGIDDGIALQEAREEVNRCKVALGERGPRWWTDGAKDLNRTLVKNSPYREWWEVKRRE